MNIFAAVNPEKRYREMVSIRKNFAVLGTCTRRLLTLIETRKYMKYLVRLVLLVAFRP